MANKESGHIHTYDEAGNMTCCSLENKVYEQANALPLLKGQKVACCSHKEEHGGHKHSHNHDHDHVHQSDGSLFQLFFPAIVSLVLLLAGIAFNNGWLGEQNWYTENIYLGWMLAAYLPVGLPVIKEMIGAIINGEFFSEFTLMTIATIGAFFLGEYPEAVAVMLFYAVGENIQSLAVKRAKNDIQSLLDQRPDEVTVFRDGGRQTIKAGEAKIGDVIEIKAGGKLALDGILLTPAGTFNTAALTGESLPVTKQAGEEVWAGTINEQGLVTIEVTRLYADSKLSKIISMVQDATSRKAPTELFIRKFARVYTPVVVLLAILITFLPYLWVAQYDFNTWLYRALVFLVISCPCALVISIPLGYFGGIGAASKHGILFKGSNYLDAMASLKHLVTDKTGTLTKGVFKVQEVYLVAEVKHLPLLKWVNALESKSTHPVASALHEYIGAVEENIILDEVEEMAGYGLKAKIEGEILLAGNAKLLKKYNIEYPAVIDAEISSVVVIAYAGKYAGYITIADELKEDAGEAIEKLKDLGIGVTMLSGDKQAVASAVAAQLGIAGVYGDLLPENKVEKVKEVKQKQVKEGEGTLAFVGDGINDAPVIAISDIGIAMGGLGSDAAIETADVVIQDDAPSRIPVAVKIGKATKKIVWQNIALAFGVKAIVLIMGAGGFATMWEAVFADVGVALLAILNAVRIQRMKLM